MATTTADYALLIDGVDISQYAYNVKDRAGRLHVPGRRGENIVLPGQHGTSYVPGKPFDENAIPLSMWAVGANADGSVPGSGDRRAQCLANLDMLVRLFQKGALISVKQMYTASTGRECYAEVKQAIDFSTMAGATRAEFAVELVVPGAFWRSIAATNQTILTGTSSPATLVFSTFAPSTAPLTGMQFDLLGPATDPVITDTTTGQWMKHSGAVPSGQHWIVDVAAWTATLNGANDIAALLHGGGASFLDLSANVAGPTVTVAGTSFNSSTSLKVTGKQSYLMA